jgi:hypothetical protein
MSEFDVVPYDASMAASWNELNETALNGHFLFHRSFMEYHADRFIDASLMLVRDGSPAAIFPANRAGSHLHSHQGLTFGGIVHGGDVRVDQVLEIVDALIAHARHGGATSITYKALPLIYHKCPADEGIYALFRHGAQCRGREVTHAIAYEAPGPRSRRRQRGVRKSGDAGLELGWDNCWDEYWLVLAEVLGRRHNRTPVHTPREMRLLADRFPGNIRLFVAKKDGSTVAGVVTFETPRVAHAQYVAASPHGQALFALDAVFDHLIGFYADTKRYFDFGISTEDGGRWLNAGLAGYKQEWGGGCVAQDTYEINL